MNTQKFLVSGIVGGIVSFLGGYLIYGLLMADFFTKNAGAVSVGVMRNMDDFVWLALCLGSLLQGLFISYIFNKWANISTLGAGAIAGLIIGFFMSSSFDSMMYATTNIMSKKGALADVICTSILAGLIGAAVGMMNGMGKKPAA